jgi:hypothetical protein
LPEVRTLLFEDFAGSNKKVQECGLLALGYTALLSHLQQQRLKGLNFDSMLRFEQRNLAPESRLARRDRFYAALGTGTMRNGTVDLRLPQADSSMMSDLMRVEEALRLRCRMHIHLCSIDVCLVA